MITYIDGILAEKNPANAIIECAGIGYLLNISLNTFSQLGNIGEKCKLYTHLVIKSEVTTPVGVSLYGFAAENERNVFISLISVSGVGYNTARLMLSSLTAEEVVSAIINENVGVFQKVKGIGTKTAQKIILDLKDKFTKLKPQSDILMPSYNKNIDEALSALVVLGFPRNLAAKAMEKIGKALPADSSVEQLIKQALQVL